MTEQTILMVSKADNSFNEENVVEVFKTSESLDDIAKILESAEDRLFTSWATVDSVDKENQKVPIDEAVKQQEILMGRGAPIQDTHTNKNVGRTLAYRVLEHPETKTTGILQLNKIYNDNVLDDKVWTSIVKGDYKGLSVGGFSTDKQYDSQDGQIFESLKGFNWLETSAVDNPCNPYATNHAMSLIAKSEEKMVENIKKQGEEDMATAQAPEVSMEDRMGAMEEAMAMMMSKMEDMMKASAGTPEVEKEAEEPKEELGEEKEVEKEAEDSEDKKEDEVEKEYDNSEVAKSLKKIESQIAELNKATRIVDVVKSERIAEVNKAEKESYSFTDVMNKKVTMKQFKGE